jgi:hypothetical protein
MPLKRLSGTAFFGVGGWRSSGYFAVIRFTQAVMTRFRNNDLKGMK